MVDGQWPETNWNNGLESATGVRQLAWIRDHTKLDVWQFACELAVEVYSLTRTLPKSEQFGLTAQMRRAAVSIPSNIAEGASRDSKGDFVRHLNIAAGSAGELDTQLHIAGRRGFAAPEPVAAAKRQVARVRKMLVGLIRVLRQGQAATRPTRQLSDH